MRRILLILCLALFSIPGFSQQGTFKVGYYDLDSLLSIMPEMSRASDSAAAYYSMLENQLYRMQASFDSLNTEYDLIKNDKEKGDEKLKMENELFEMQNRIQLFQQQAQQDYANLRAALVEPIYQKILAASARVAKKKGYAMILDSSKTTGVVMYSSNTYDVFSDMCKELGITPYPAYPGRR